MLIEKPARTLKKGDVGVDTDDSEITVNSVERVNDQVVKINFVSFGASSNPHIRLHHAARVRVLIPDSHDDHSRAEHPEGCTECARERDDRNAEFFEDAAGEVTCG